MPKEIEVGSNAVRPEPLSFGRNADQDSGHRTFGTTPGQIELRIGVVRLHLDSRGSRRTSFDAKPATHTLLTIDNGHGSTKPNRVDSCGTDPDAGTALRPRERDAAVLQQPDASKPHEGFLRHLQRTLPARSRAGKAVAHPTRSLFRKHHRRPSVDAVGECKDGCVRARAHAVSTFRTQRSKQQLVDRARGSSTMR